jgi:hypothetical protein
VPLPHSRQSHRPIRLITSDSGQIEPWLERNRWKSGESDVIGGEVR